MDGSCRSENKVKSSLITAPKTKQKRECQCLAFDTTSHEHGASKASWIIVLLNNSVGVFTQRPLKSAQRRPGRKCSLLTRRGRRSRAGRVSVQLSGVSRKAALSSFARGIAEESET